MAILEKQAVRPFIDLSGPSGNAFSLMGHAMTYGRQLGMSAAEIDVMLEDMQSSNYEHLVEVFDQKFGLYVDLYR